MRSWFAALSVFLLLWLPLQPGWATMVEPLAQNSAQVTTVRAASPHCHHEQIADSASVKQADAASELGDCHFCHGALALLREPLRPLVDAPFAPIAGSLPLPASHPSELPDRPQWTARG